MWTFLSAVLNPVYLPKRTALPKQWISQETEVAQHACIANKGLCACVYRRMGSSSDSRLAD